MTLGAGGPQHIEFNHEDTKSPRFRSPELLCVFVTLW